MNINLIKKNIIFGILYTSFLAPFIFFMLGLPMILQIEGFSPSIIGIFQLIGLPATIKFLLSTPIDKFVFKKNSYKKWVVVTGIVYATFLCCISFLSLKDNFNIVLITIIITTLISTFIDIPLNALSIKLFTKEERVIAGGYKASSYFIAGILGGGIFLLIYNHLGWQKIFIIMATMILISLLALKFIEEKDEHIEQPKISFKVFLSFFKQPRIGIWIFILSFYFAFISAIWIFMKPYLITKGISPDDVAWYVGIYGSIIGSMSGLLVNIISKKVSKRTLLLVFMLFNIVSVFILTVSEFLNFEIKSYLFISVTLTAVAISLSSSIIFTLIMDYSRDTSRAIDYSIQSSLFSLTRIISAIIAGILVSNFNFSFMFIFELICLILVVLFIYKNYED